MFAYQSNYFRGGLLFIILHQRKDDASLIPCQVFANFFHISSEFLSKTLFTCSIVLMPAIYLMCTLHSMLRHALFLEIVFGIDHENVLYVCQCCFVYIYLTIKCVTFERLENS